jgi:hypothetical protein
MSAAPALPRWADIGLLPLVNLAIALVVAGIVVAFIGQNPLDGAEALVQGAFGSARGISYTLYFTTTFIFTGLAVAVAGTRASSTSAPRGRRRSAAWAPGSSRCGWGPRFPASSCSAHRRRGLRPSGALGGGARVPAGVSRQPHRHHDDHVQLHRVHAPRVPPGERPQVARPDVGRERRIRALGAPADDVGGASRRSAWSGRRRR